MEKRAFLHVEPHAAQTPVGAEHVVETKQLMLRTVQRALGDQHEIHHILFILAAPHGAAAMGAGSVKRHFAERLLFDGAYLKSLVTLSENGTQSAVAGLCSIQPSAAESQSVAN